MCAPDLGDDYASMDMPANWPDHLDAAIRCIDRDNHILPNMKYSPNELLLGLVINTTATSPTEALAPPTPEEVEVQMAYVDSTVIHKLSNTPSTAKQPLTSEY
jgi:hypothetical protein